MEFAIIGVAAMALIAVGAASVAVSKAREAKETLRLLKEEMDGFIEALRRKRK